MKKRTTLLIGFITLVVIGYLLLKPQDYRVGFTVNTFAGTINQSIKSWHRDHKTAIDISQRSLYEIDQTLQFNDSIHRYHWKIIPKNDSVSRVEVDILDAKNSIANRLAVLTGNTPIINRSKKEVSDFAKKLNEHIQSFRVHSFEEVELPGTYYAYLTIKGSLRGKARGMMQNLPFLSGFLFENQVDLNGSPFIEILDWDQTKDSITYNFCYPVLRSERLPIHPEVKFKRFFDKRALKVEYNGNYISSDRAWYALLDYAKTNDISVVPTPIEYFYNNPNMGGNELSWKAEIFLPIKEDEVKF